MDIPKETEDYMRESIKHSLGLPVSEKTLGLKLLASEEDRRHLQAENLNLHDQLKEFQKLCPSYKAEAAKNAQGLRENIQEKEVMVSSYAQLDRYCAKLDRECMLLARDLKKAMESCNELEKEKNELKDQLRNNSSHQALSTEVKRLKEDKETLVINLQRAEEKVKVMFEESRVLENLNQKLLSQLQREEERHKSDYRNSASASPSSWKRKPSNKEELSRPPLSPLHRNSPESSLPKQ